MSPVWCRSHMLGPGRAGGKDMHKKGKIWDSWWALDTGNHLGTAQGAPPASHSSCWECPHSLWECSPPCWECSLLLLGEFSTPLRVFLTLFQSVSHSSGRVHSFGSVPHSSGSAPHSFWECFPLLLGVVLTPLGVFPTLFESVSHSFGNVPHSF